MPTPDPENVQTPDPVLPHRAENVQTPDPALTGGAFKDPKTISTVCSARDDDIEYIYGSLPR